MNVAVAFQRLGLASLLCAAALPSSAEVIVGLTSTNQLVTFRTEDPSRVSPPVSITGLQVSESILGIDFRPATGQLYGLGTTDRLYIIDTATGAATQLGDPIPFIPDNFTFVAFDFNPVPDRIRVFTSTGQSYRLNPNNGALSAQDMAPTYAAGDPFEAETPELGAAAYTDNLVGVTATTLLAFDSDLGNVVVVGSRGGSPQSPNGGVCTTIGTLLGVQNFGPTVGMDASGASTGVYFSVQTSGSTTGIYKVDDFNGAGRVIGTVPALLRDISVMPRSPEERIYVLNNNNQLYSFLSTTPGLVDGPITITGLPGGTTLRGLDQRPATGAFYSLGDDEVLYTFGRDGVATAVGAPIAEIASNVNTGFDFNPSVDRIRLVSLGGNFRIHPDTGAVVSVDTPVAYALGDPNNGTLPEVVSAAYSNNRAGATPTTLYVIDSVTNDLATQGSVGGTPTSPNLGTLFTIGSLGINVSGDPGFDISASSGVAYLAASRADLPRGSAPIYLHRVDLATGAATAIGGIEAAIIMRGMVVDTAPTTDPNVVFTALDRTQWIPFTVNPPYAEPAFADGGGLQITVNGVPTNTFGVWQTIGEIAPLPRGQYRAHITFTPIGEVDGARLPEIRVRLFNFDNTQSRFAVVADSIPANPSPKSVDVLWESDGVTPWRAAFDILSFLPEIQGGYTFTGITFTPEP